MERTSIAVITRAGRLYMRLPPVDISVLQSKRLFAIIPSTLCIRPGFHTKLTIFVLGRFLIERGARVDIVNNDGELPIDIADTDEMESLLQSEIFKQGRARLDGGYLSFYGTTDTFFFSLYAGVDIDLARSEEEQIMLRDVREWYNGNSVKENVHPKTGATPLHVAAAKGYVEVMR